jgi:hypothetical protein
MLCVKSFLLPDGLSAVKVDGEYNIICGLGAGGFLTRTGNVGFAKG